MALVYLLILQSLPSNGSTCYNINVIIVVISSTVVKKILIHLLIFTRLLEFGNQTLHPWMYRYTNIIFCLYYLVLSIMFLTITSIRYFGLYIMQNGSAHN
jgi:hypothetical protein